MLSICSSEAGPISDPLGGHSLDSTVGVLVRAALPGGVRVRKIKGNRSGCCGELPVQREFRPAVRRNAFYPIRRQKDEQKDHRVTAVSRNAGRTELDSCRKVALPVLRSVIFKSAACENVPLAHFGAVDKVCFQKYGLAKSLSNSIYFTVNNNKQARKTYLLFR